MSNQMFLLTPSGALNMQTRQATNKILQIILLIHLAYFDILLQIVKIFAVHCEYLVPRPKYLGPSSSNIQHFTCPDQKLPKNIYFMGSEWSISLSVLDQSCSVSHLQQPTLGQNDLTKIGARPDKTRHKLLLGPKILA